MGEGFYRRTLRRMLFRSNFAIRAPVAVVYDGGGVYFGGASSMTSDTGLLSNETAMAGIADTSSSAFNGRLVFGERAILGCGYRCDTCPEQIDGR